MKHLFILNSWNLFQSLSILHKFIFHNHLQSNKDADLHIEWHISLIEQKEASQLLWQNLTITAIVASTQQLLSFESTFVKLIEKDQFFISAKL